MTSLTLSSSGLWDYTMLFFFFLLSSLCALSARPVNTMRFMWWRKYIASKPPHPRGCCPLCHLSSPCLRTQHVQQAPRVAPFLRHTRWLVCMSVCVFYEVSGCHRLAASETSKVPGGHLQRDPLLYVLSHVITAKTGWRGKKQNSKRGGSSNQNVQRSCFT